MMVHEQYTFENRFLEEKKRKREGKKGFCLGEHSNIHTIRYGVSNTTSERHFLRISMNGMR